MTGPTDPPDPTSTDPPPPKGFTGPSPPLTEPSPPLKATASPPVSTKIFALEVIPTVPTKKTPTTVLQTVAARLQKRLSRTRQPTSITIASPSTHSHSYSVPTDNKEEKENKTTRPHRPRQLGPKPPSRLIWISLFPVIQGRTPSRMINPCPQLRRQTVN